VIVKVGWVMKYILFYIFLFACFKNIVAIWGGGY
jgi:hypothetical protein